MRFDIRGAAFAVQCPDLVTGDSGGANPTPCTNHPAHSSPRGSRKQSPRETLLTSGLMSLTSRSGAALSSGRPHVSLPGGSGPNVASSCSLPHVPHVRGCGSPWTAATSHCGAHTSGSSRALGSQDAASCVSCLFGRSEDLPSLPICWRSIMEGCRRP